MPASRAASVRDDPSSTSAKASIRREAAPARSRPAARRSPAASNSNRVIATATIAASLRCQRQRIITQAAPETLKSQQSSPGV